MLSNKNIIVTGSSSGIGLSITKALLKNKANVLGISRRNPNFSNKNYHHIQFDLSNIETEYEKLNSYIKEKPIDGLMKNIMTEKVDQHHQDWHFAEEGLTIELPLNSDEIVMSNFDA